VPNRFTIYRSDAAVIACHASSRVLDAMPGVSGTYAARIAADESMLLGSGPSRGAIFRAAREYVCAIEPDALVLDQSDAWWVTTIPDAGRQLLNWLSVVRPPDERPAFYQGIVAGLPAKVLIDARAVHVLVPSPVGHHLESRIRDVWPADDPLDIGLAPLTFND
jgi:hypothetical protein